MENRNKFILAIAAIAIIIVVVFALSNSNSGQNIQQNQNDSKTIITVSAAASLTEALNDIEQKYESENPNIDLKMNYAASGNLRQQIEGGAPIDVFASAAQDQMDMLASKGFVYNDTRKDFVGNDLVMIVPKGNILNLNSTKDLVKPEVKRISLGDPATTPAGRYAQETLMQEGTWDGMSNKIVKAESVKQALVYVERNEVDAGFVFKTDATSAQPDTVQIITTVPTITPVTYPIAVVKTTTHEEESKKYISYVTGDEGRAIMEKYGFSTP